MDEERNELDNYIDLDEVYKRMEEIDALMKEMDDPNTPYKRREEIARILIE